MTAAIQIGDAVYYVLGRAPSNGRPRDLWLRGQVVGVTAKRVIVQLHSGGRPRTLHPLSLTKNEPPTNVDVR